MRPRAPRLVRCPPCAREFSPVDDAGLPPVTLNIEELEAVRLADLLALNQTDGAARMEVSRATFGRILERARAKVARTLVQGRRLQITGEAEAPPVVGETMRVAIAISETGSISRHFRRSHAYRIVDVSADGQRVVEDRTGPPRDPGVGRRRHRGGHGNESSHTCGRSGWLDLFGDCQAALTLGMGSGAKDGLKRRGVRPIILDHPTSVEAALDLLREGRL